MAWMKELEEGVRLEMDDYNCHPLEMRWQEKKDDGPLVAF